MGAFGHAADGGLGAAANERGYSSSRHSPLGLDSGPGPARSSLGPSPLGQYGSYSPHRALQPSAAAPAPPVAQPNDQFDQSFWADDGGASAGLSLGSDPRNNPTAAGTFTNKFWSGAPTELSRPPSQLYGQE